MHFRLSRFLFVTCPQWNALHCTPLWKLCMKLTNKIFYLKLNILFALVLKVHPSNLDIWMWWGPGALLLWPHRKRGWESGECEAVCNQYWCFFIFSKADLNIKLALWHLCIIFLKHCKIYTDIYCMYENYILLTEFPWFILYHNLSIC